jgi:hypothetical protein
MTALFFAAFLLFILLGIIAIILGRKIVGFVFLGVALFVAVAFVIFLLLVARSNM